MLLIFFVPFKPMQTFVASHAPEKTSVEPCGHTTSITDHLTFTTPIHAPVSMGPRGVRLAHGKVTVSSCTSEKVLLISGVRNDFLNLLRNSCCRRPGAVVLFQGQCPQLRSPTTAPIANHTRTEPRAALAVLCSHGTPAESSVPGPAARTPARLFVNWAGGIEAELPWIDP